MNPYHAALVPTLIHTLLTLVADPPQSNGQLLSIFQNKPNVCMRYPCLLDLSEPNILLLTTTGTSLCRASILWYPWYAPSLLDENMEIFSSACTSRISRPLATSEHQVPLILLISTGAKLIRSRICLPTNFRKKLKFGHSL